MALFGYMTPIDASTTAELFTAEHFRRFANLLSASEGITPRFPRLPHPAVPHAQERSDEAPIATDFSHLFEIGVWIDQAVWFGLGFYAQARGRDALIFAIRPASEGIDWTVFVFDPLVERARLHFPTLLGAALFVLKHAEPIHP